MTRKIANMAKNAAAILLLMTYVCILSACQRYSFAINENVVYEPPPLFQDYKIEDKTLRNCVAAAIVEQEVRKPEQLKKLTCPPGQIESLVGLETFNQLQQLGLAQNQISNIITLKKLTELKKLDLRENQIIDFSVLQSLQKLEQVYTKGNIDADCSTLPSEFKNLRLDKPEHCLT